MRRGSQETTVVEGFLASTDAAEVGADVAGGFLPLASKTHHDRYCLMFARQVCRFELVVVSPSTSLGSTVH